MNVNFRFRSSKRSKISLEFIDNNDNNTFSKNTRRKKEESIVFNCFKNISLMLLSFRFNSRYLLGRQEKNLNKRRRKKKQTRQTINFYE